MTDQMTEVVEKKSSKAIRVVLMIALCGAVFGTGVLRSYQAGVEMQAKQVMRQANDPAAVAAAQHQIQWAKNIVKR
jgi:hypothetical protein